MSHSLPACPHLPAPRPGLDWRTLHVHREDVRGEAFYHDCLEYAQSLWERGLSARAVLCLDRAMGADLRGDEPMAVRWPIPYAALAWFLTYHPEEVFLGNPRIHFQHYAGRMNEPRREQRRWRAWACWAVTRAMRPEFAGDPRHQIDEPTEREITERLDEFGWPGETEAWRQLVRAADPSDRAP